MIRRMMPLGSMKNTARTEAVLLALSCNMP